MGLLGSVMGLVLAALGPGETQVLEVLRPGPVRTGVHLPEGTGNVRLIDPAGRTLPSQWRWQPFGVAHQGRRWAVLCFEAPNRGRYRIVAAPGPGPATLAMPVPALPELFLEGAALPVDDPGETWVGPVCAVRTASTWSGGGLWWWLQVEEWAGGERRITLEVAWLERGRSGPLELALALPGGPEEWQVVRGGGRVVERLWHVLPPGTRLEPGEAWLARLRGSLGASSQQHGPRWGDQPGRPAGRAPFDRLPAGPDALPVFGAPGLAGVDRALDQALRSAVQELTLAEDPRDRGDLRDRHGAWLNLEYDLAWALVLHFQRTGDPLFLEAALEGSDHVTSTDRACLGRVGEVRGLPHVHGPEHRGRGTESGHVWLQGQLGAALLAGDERLVRRSAETVFALVGILQDRGGRRIARTLGWPSLAFAAWEEWADAPPVVATYAALAGQVARVWSEEEGAFLLPGESLAPGLWLVHPWVQLGLLTRPALRAAPGAPWGERLARLLAPALAPGCTESLVIRVGGAHRPGRRATLPHLALALEGSAPAASGEEAWQREARELARGMEKALRGADGRELALLGRAWPVIALGRMGPRDQRSVRVPR